MGSATQHVMSLNVIEERSVSTLQSLYLPFYMRESLRYIKAKPGLVLIFLNYIQFKRLF